MSATHHSIDMYPVHRVPASRPFVWLMQGWDDLWHHRAASLAYGALVAAMGALILAYQRHPAYITAAMATFLLVGPIITAGLCELSRSRDHGEAATFQSSLLALGRCRKQLLAFGQVLAVIALLACAIGALFLYAASGSVAPAIQSTVWGDVMAQLSTMQVTTYVATFGILGAVVFVLSVVSVPMIIDRHVDAGSAMQMSLRVAQKDLPAMLVWAALIVGLVALGFVTQLWGMIVVLPLLGHATWSAYRDMVEEA